MVINVRKKMKREGGWGVLGRSIGKFNSGIGEDTQNLEEGREIQRKSISGRRDGKCKGPEVRVFQAHFRSAGRPL